MNENLKSKIAKRLDELSDQRGRQVLDYILFLESKYNRSQRTPSPIQRIAESVDETLGASRIADVASKGTSQLVEAAGRVMEGLAEAGKVVVDEIQAGLGPGTSKDGEPEAEAQEEAPEAQADDSAEEERGRP